jgi:hypothetical protein
MNSIHRTIEAAGPDRASLCPWSLAVLLAACLVGFLSPGCSSIEKPASARFASIEIQDQPHERVRDVTAEVFRDHGYLVTRNGWADLIFEREGSTMNNLAYGNWMGGRVWVRVKAAISDLSARNCRLQCEAFILRNRGEALEEEIRITKVHSRPYQDLLDEVAKRLGGSTTSTPPAGSGT